MLNLKTTTLENMKAKKLSEVLIVIECIVAKKHSVYLIEKDLLRHSLKKLTSLSIHAPTSFIHDILLNLQMRFPRNNKIVILLSRFECSPHYFTTILGSNFMKMARHFSLPDENVSMNNMSSLLLAIKGMTCKRTELQGMLPCCVTDFFKLKRLSVPQLIAVTHLISLNLAGVVNSNSDPLKTQFVAKHITNENNK